MQTGAFFLRMATPDDYRDRAARCQSLAQRSLTNSDRVRWLSMAQFWMRLAQQETENGPATVTDELSRTIVAV